MWWTDVDETEYWGYWETSMGNEQDDTWVDSSWMKRAEAAEAQVAAMKDHLADLDRVFELTFKAHIRAIKKWHEAHPERGEVWPDHTDLCMWLMRQLDEKEKADGSKTDKTASTEVGEDAL